MKNFENSPPAIKHYLSIRSVSVSIFYVRTEVHY